ncbi:hypothetical protein ABFT23_11850 [Nocardioides sp. C4-1]|uniref:hypothetical protein n=1 Tax=Nocardioides sp. C4-1 TaxID=3151851 RepID=UPI003266E9D7
MSDEQPSTPGPARPALRRPVVVVGAVVVLVVAAVLVVVRLGGDDDERGRLERAVAFTPRDSQRILWTDWAGVRDELGADLGADPSAAEVQDLLDRGFESDLTSTSALGSSAVAMQERLGFSPATLEWELYTQSESGAALVLQLADGVSTDDVTDRLAGLGYAEPTDDDGYWVLGTDAPFSTEITPELVYLTFDDDAGLVIAGDNAAGPAEARESVRAASSEPVPDGVVAQLGAPLSAAIFTGSYACSALAMGNADDRDRAAADDLVAQAGEIDPLTGFGMGVEPGGSVRVTMGFETEAQARTNADTRARLATGPAPGQGGDFADRFALAKASAEGSVVVLDLDPVDGAYVVSDLSSGPVLFATC